MLQEVPFFLKAGNSILLSSLLSLGTEKILAHVSGLRLIPQNTCSNNIIPLLKRESNLAVLSNSVATVGFSGSGKQKVAKKQKAC